MLRLRVERLRRGLSLAKVCMLTGIDPGALSRVERGIWPAGPGWRRRVAEAFGLPEDELFREVADDGQTETHRGQ